jgi:dihydroxyacetone kinase
MELAILARDAMSLLAAKGFHVERLYAGAFLSSLDMAGISISLLGLNDEWLRWLDAPTTAPAWPNLLNPPAVAPDRGVRASKRSTPPVSNDSSSDSARKTRRAIESACRALIAAEPELTELDRITGDGDLGAGMQRAAKAVEAAIGSYPLDDLPATIKALAHTLRRELGGSSGPLYGVLSLRCGSVLDTAGTIGVEQWAQALEQGCQAISELGGAQPGDRTMLDALVPFVKALQSRESLLAAVAAADRGVADTAQMKARLGRSSYLGDRVLGHPDPGAKAVAIWLRAAVEALLVGEP